MSQAEALETVFGVDGESSTSTRDRQQSDIESSSTNVRTRHEWPGNPRPLVGVPSEYAQAGEASTRLWRSLHKVEI